MHVMCCLVSEHQPELVVTHVGIQQRSVATHIYMSADAVTAGFFGNVKHFLYAGLPSRIRAALL